MTQQNRRTFLHAAGAAAVATAARPILGANDRINLVVIGLGGRGQAHMREYLQQQDCRVSGLCDVNQEAVERGQALVLKSAGATPKPYYDMRKVFDDKEVDAVSMPTPNHWHALGGIWACQAGKDVYLEKPACHNVWEGQKLVEAARKYKRMVQIGSQSRSTPHKIKAMQLLHDGVIGKVYMAKGMCYKRRPSIGHTPDTPTPPGLNWDMFLGPAPMRPFNMNRFKYNWHWFWDTGNGDIGNQGVHEMDIARWGLGKEGFPKSVYSTGGKFVYQDDQETPNTQLAIFDYDGVELQFEVRGILTGGESGVERHGKNSVGNVFFGSDGYLAVDGDGFKVYKGENHELAMDEKGKDNAGTGLHMANFLKACRSRNAKDLNAESEIGVTSADLCHLANISYRLGRKLTIDPAGRKFINDNEANKMLTRPYRAPYVVPEKV